MLRRLVLLLALAVSLGGCETVDNVLNFNKERYARNNDQGKAWLSDQLLPAEANISGKWKCDDWGPSAFAQTDRIVRGHLGQFPVEGVVSGRKAYLCVSDGGWIYYSVVLDIAGPDMLVGYYSRSVPYKSDQRKDIRLDRAAE